MIETCAGGVMGVKMISAAGLVCKLSIRGKRWKSMVPLYASRVLPVFSFQEYIYAKTKATGNILNGTIQSLHP